MKHKWKKYKTNDDGNYYKCRNCGYVKLKWSGIGDMNLFQNDSVQTYVLCKNGLDIYTKNEDDLLSCEECIMESVLI